MTMSISKTGSIVMRLFDNQQFGISSICSDTCYRQGLYGLAVLC